MLSVWLESQDIYLSIDLVFVGLCQLKDLTLRYIAGLSNMLFLWPRLKLSTSLIKPRCQNQFKQVSIIKWFSQKQGTVCQQNLWRKERER